MLNHDKTCRPTCNLFCQHALTTPQVPYLKTGSYLVTPSPMVRIIGLYMISVMDMEQQFQKICQSCYFNIFLTKFVTLKNKSVEILVHAFITSRLDNGNALLYGISVYTC